MTDDTEDEFLFSDEIEDGEPRPDGDSDDVSSETKESPAHYGSHAPWKVLIVDDDPEVFEITALVLNDITYRNRKLELLNAQSAVEAREILREQQDDIAVILLDVVMETDDAGLNLVKVIRDELDNQSVRIILRTGQPGHAPEKEVILNYDINDYRAKTELTSQKLFSTTIAALRAYEDIMALEVSRKGLEKIIDATSALFQEKTLDDYARGVLMQIDALLGLGSKGILLAQSEDEDDSSKNNDQFKVIASCDHMDIDRGLPVEEALDSNILTAISETFEKRENVLRDDNTSLYVNTPNGRKVVIHLESSHKLGEIDIALLDVFAKKISIGMDNLYLIEHLKGSHEATVMVLAALAEYKDSDTGQHIFRVAKISTDIASKMLELGHYTDKITDNFLDQIGPASMLHDVGKVSIPDSILLKPGSLTTDEREVMEQHAMNGGNILERGCDGVDETSYLLLGAEVAWTHHEHFDGNGYPNKLAGDDIPLSGRIVAVADVFDALVSKRPYKDPWPVEDAVAFIQERAGAQFDPKVVEAFLQVMEQQSAERAANAL